jgi:predicted transport protein
MVGHTWGTHQSGRIMADIQKALATQLTNIEARTGKTLEQLITYVRNSGLAKHSEIVGMLKSSLGLGHGDANTIAHLAKGAGQAPGGSTADPLDALYTGPKAALRPIHDALLPHLSQLGSFDTNPKQKYVSYRRKKQFAMIGPATNTRVEVGLNVKALPNSPRLEIMPVGRMCNYRVKLTDRTQVDAELVAWIKAAYAAAG